MGVFGKLFEKKECDICGGEIGLLGNRKLEDGNLCKNCANKLSPWFSERRHSTVAEIKKQLAYREENRKKAAQFQITQSFGEDWKVLLDKTHQWFTVTRARNLEEANPDILDFSALTGCRMDIDESHTELKHDGPDGKQVSYNPPRYEYSYDFYMVITVNNPYFDEMRFRLNPSTVELVSEVPRGFTMSRSMDPNYNIAYRKYKQMGDKICAEAEQIQQITQNTLRGEEAGDCASAQKSLDNTQEYANRTGAAAPAGGPWACPACGAENSGKFCESCGTPRPSTMADPCRCAGCGWHPGPGEKQPKFCPECGQPIR